MEASAPGPETGSTGEGMSAGMVFLSVNDRHKADLVDLANQFAWLGFQLAATRGTADALASAGLKCKKIFKVNEGRPNAVGLMKAGQLQLAIYTSAGAHSFSDERIIRRTAIAYRVPCITTMSAAKAAVEAIASRRQDPVRVWALQDIHGAR
ncbi:MAG: hypothetical protein Q8N47_21150 [Bryobacterales bacterium]|nr:hypothetical protein [Bryobacterales bacterium]